MASTLKSRKDSLLYAPMANVGRVTMDRDGLYIELKNINYTKKDQLYLADQSLGQKTGELGYTERSNAGGKGQDGMTPVEILRSMQDVKMGVDQQLKSSKRASTQALSLFAGGAEQEGSDDGYGSQPDSDAESEEDEGSADETGTEGEDEEGDDDNSETGEGDAWDNEYDDQYEEEEGSESGSDSGSESADSEEEEERDVARAATTKTPSASLGQLWEDSAAKTAKEPKPAASTSADRAQGVVVRGAEGMATGHADLMRAVYGNNWAAGVSKDSKTLGEVEEEESDDDLFALPGVGKGTSGQQQRKSAKQAQHLLDNTLDSSRVWNGPPPAGLDSGLVRGEHKGSVATSSGALNEHATLLDHLRFLEKTAGVANGKNGGQQSDVVLVSALPSTEKNSNLPAETSENWWEMMKSRCVTGGFKNKITADGGAQGGDDSDGEGFGEFEDLQTGEKFGGKTTSGMLHHLCVL